jgi:Zn-dependent protease
LRIFIGTRNNSTGVARLCQSVREYLVQSTECREKSIINYVLSSGYSVLLLGMFSLDYLLYIVPALFIAMAFHEAMHAFTAHWLGDDTASDQGRVSLNPLVHIDPVLTIALPTVMLLFGLPPILAAKPVPFNPNRVKFDEMGAALVGIAGPITNLILALVSAVLLRLIEFPSVLTNFLVIFCLLNVSLFVFNMIPIPPLDGSRLLYAFAPDSVQRIMQQIEAMGFMFLIVILLVLLPVIGPIIQDINSEILKLILGSQITL